MKILDILYKNGYKHTESFKGFSSLNTVSTLLQKGDKKVRVGLNEKGYPPSLIAPRPKHKEKPCTFFNSKHEKVEGVWHDTEYEDAEVIEWIQNTSEEEIINFIENNA